MTTNYGETLKNLEARAQEANDSGDEKKQQEVTDQFTMFLAEVAEKAGVSTTDLRRCILIEGAENLASELAHGCAAAAFCGWDEFVSAALDVSDRLSDLGNVAVKANRAIDVKFFAEPKVNAVDEPEKVAQNHAMIRVELERVANDGKAKRESALSRILDDMAKAASGYAGAINPSLLACFCGSINDLKLGIAAIMTYSVYTGDTDMCARVAKLAERLIEVDGCQRQLNEATGIAQGVLGDNGVETLTELVNYGRMAAVEAKEKLAA